MAYDSKFKRDDIDELFDGVLTLKDREDCYRFFEDICTINEIHAIAQRLQVAKLLSQKKTYSEIEEITKASTVSFKKASSLPINPNKDEIVSIVVVCRQVYRIR